MKIISTLIEGTKCHAFVSDCKGNVLFERRMKDCSSTCLVMERDDIPSNASYCPSMVVHGKNGDKRQKAVNNVDKSGCFEVSGNIISFSFKEIECPKELPKICDDPE
ncbi:16712_t:CDS:1 [Gigaspora margarita]|uniref:16712_t:CDS:1 n=1 Tax=Gigaspora margarita TaxID=4874 RepID=A0ABN7VR62_GIGMA|nr:16712_t:CDS:1 [Gigaspora margarita]